MNRGTSLVPRGRRTSPIPMGTSCPFSGRNNRTSFSLFVPALRQRKRHHVVAQRRTARYTVSTGADHHILLSIRRSIRHRRCASAGRKIALPKLGAPFDVESVDGGIQSTRHEYYAAGRDDRPSQRNRSELPKLRDFFG